MRLHDEARDLVGMISLGHGDLNMYGICHVSGQVETKSYVFYTVFHFFAYMIEDQIKLFIPFIALLLLKKYSA